MPDLPAANLPQVRVTASQLYPGSSAEVWMDADWSHAIQFFVGRNGSGKSRMAKALVDSVRNSGGSARLLSTDRLVGLMAFTSYQFGSVTANFKGTPLGDDDVLQARNVSLQQGAATDALLTLREFPDVSLRLGALLRRAFGRRVRLTERSGFLDPIIETDAGSYSLLRDEGHGLRELVVLLVNVYRPDWQLLVVDEPELHLHPSLTRICMAELEEECLRTNRRAVVVTHEPRLLTPQRMSDLAAVWVFRPDVPPKRLADGLDPVVHPNADARIRESLNQYPALVADLVFSPRPVLVEGPGDVAALKATLTRLAPPVVVAQTDLVPCGGRNGIPLWLDIATLVGLDVRAIADLDAILDGSFRRVVDQRPGVREALALQLYAENETSHEAIRPLLHAAGNAGAADNRAKAQWIASLHQAEDVAATSRRDTLLAIWADAGVWLHPEGTIEDALRLSSHSDAPTLRRRAEEHTGLDKAALWAAFRLKTDADEFDLLGLEVERIATTLLAELRTTPDRRFTAPIGSNSESDSRLVQIEPLEHTHRLTVAAPEKFAGYWLEVDRDTPLSGYVLHPPSEGAPSEGTADKQGERADG